jgi:LacI family transcriptional regulator
MAGVRNRSEPGRDGQGTRIAVLVDTATGWGRRLVRGVTNYARGRAAWHLWVEPRGQNEHLRVPYGWDGDGVVARISDQRTADELAALRVPVVNVSGIELPRCEFPRVTTNYDASARLAAEHFLERGYHSFAYVGPLRRGYVRRHAQAFEQVVRDTAAAGCALFDYRDDLAGHGRAWAERERELGDWMQQLPKPVGIFGWATAAGAHVLALCRARGIATPDDVAVLAGDDDPLLCDTTSPAMSAVVVASEQIGFHAAARLDRLLRGRRDAGGDELIDPISVTTRGSTEAFAIDDPELRQAMIFLRHNAYRPLSVGEIADAVPMARRSLERKFRQMTGRTPLDEIRRLRLNRVKELLAMTDRSVADIADATGFGTPAYMTATFRHAERITPLRYRRQVRGL